MSRFEGSRTLITGGAAGIGRLLALEAARRGAEVIVWDLAEEAMARTVAEITALGQRPAHGYRCDVGDRAQVYAVAEQVVEEVGPVDILVNNAGVVSGKTFLELPDERIELTFRVNTLALFWTTKAFLPGMMRRDRGHVVTVASAAGWIGVKGLADYSASKFAAVGFDESLRQELKANAPGVHTTVVCPYYIDTGMFEGVKTRFPAILPILEPEKVALEIADAIARNRTRLMLPPIVYSVPLLRGLPLRAFDRVANVLGINASMEEFKGR
ncbi:MAG: SDR family oxidoreductase [Pseudomonadota bacterium]